MKRFISCILLFTLLFHAFSYAVTYRDYDWKKDFRRYEEAASKQESRDGFKKLIEEGSAYVLGQFETLLQLEQEETKNEARAKLHQELEAETERKEREWQAIQSAKKARSDKEGEVQSFKDSLNQETKSFIQQYYNSLERNSGALDAFFAFLGQKKEEGKVLAEKIKQSSEEKINLADYDDELKQSLSLIYKEWDLEINNSLNLSSNQFLIATLSDFLSLKNQSLEEGALKQVSDALNAQKTQIEILEKGIFDVIEGRANAGELSINGTVDLSEEVRRKINEGF